VRVTHRFHPLSGQSFEFVKRLQAWQSDLVYFLDAAGELVSVPAAWTDQIPATTRLGHAPRSPHPRP